MMKKMMNSQVMRYIMTGGAVTAVNYLIYFLLQAAETGWLAANSAAWLGAVIFAYCANRRIVFRSEGNRCREFIQFFSLRLVTLLIENLLLFLLIDCISIGDAAGKILVSVITVILNYSACRYSIFKERGVSRE